jgi:hypothetical protein
MPRRSPLPDFLLIVVMALAPVAVRTVLAQPCGGDANAAAGCCLLLPIGLVPPAGDFLVGCSGYVLESGHGGGHQATCALLDLPPCPSDPCGTTSGADAIRCWAENGYPCCVDLFTAMRVVSGNKGGAFRRGLQARWARDTDQRSGICVTEYNGNGSRLVEVLVVDSFDAHGGVVAQTRRYARFFLVNLPLRPGDDLLGNFVTYVAH